VPAPESIAALLTCRPDSPLLAVERVAYTYDDAPMEWRVGHYNTATHHYVTALD
jgi:GntR family transcriptional regulator